MTTPTSNHRHALAIAQLTATQNARSIDRNAHCILADWILPMKLISDVLWQAVVAASQRPNGLKFDQGQPFGHKSAQRF